LLYFVAAAALDNAVSVELWIGRKKWQAGNDGETFTEHLFVARIYIVGLSRTPQKISGGSSSSGLLD